MVIFPPATSGTSPMSGIYASLRQAQIIVLEILQCMDACPAVFKRGGYNFRLPPLKVRDLRLDLGKNS